jgi:hypothetical protein
MEAFGIRQPVDASKINVPQHEKFGRLDTNNAKASKCRYKKILTRPEQEQQNASPNENKSVALAIGI